MKFLLDENLSYRILPKILDLYPNSAHVKEFDLIESDDGDIWDYAILNDYVILSKDSDFHQRSILDAPPPKLVFLRVGNCSTGTIVNLLRSKHEVIEIFAKMDSKSILVLQ